LLKRVKKDNPAHKRRNPPSKKCRENWWSQKTVHGSAKNTETKEGRSRTRQFHPSKIERASGTVDAHARKREKETSKEKKTKGGSTTPKKEHEKKGDPYRKGFSSRGAPSIKKTL